MVGGGPGGYIPVFGSGLGKARSWFEIGAGFVEKVPAPDIAGCTVYCGCWTFSCDGSFGDVLYCEFGALGKINESSSKDKRS